MKPLLIIFLLVNTFCFAQVGINTTTPKANLDITATNQASPTNTDGILIPRIDAFPATSPTAVQQGMMVYLTTTSGTNAPGFYYWDNGTSTWVSVAGTKNTLDQAYDEGGAGAGRTITADNGALIIAGTDGLLVNGLNAQGQNILVTGTGSRMFFNPKKGAFRAGDVRGNFGLFNNNVWNDVNVGKYSFAGGINTLASGQSSTAFGSLSKATGDYSIAIGELTTASGYISTAMGNYTTASGNKSTAIGNYTTAPSYAETTIGSYNRSYAPQSTTAWNNADRLFVIGNGVNSSSRSNALTIYKSGLLNINDAYNMPLTDGTANQVMTTNGAGQVSFVNSNTVGTDDQKVDSFALSGTTLGISLENDGVAPVTVDLSSLQDGVGAQKINDLSDGKSDNDGTNNGSSIFLGVSAGLFDDATDNGNVGIGFNSLVSNISGVGNIAIGYKAFKNTTGSSNVGIGYASGLVNTGNGNTFIGTKSGYNNLGSSNIFIGFTAGYFETGSNKLYIDNSSANADYSLIYGEFDTNILRTNSQFQIGNPAGTGYAFPTTDGTTNQVIQTDGSGNLNWVNATSLGTDDQKVDSFALSGTTLGISLENDGVAPVTVDLSSLQDGTGTDDQKVDSFALSGTTLGISLENDGVAPVTVDLSSLQDGTGTDDQKVDSFALSGTTLGISLENDGVAPVTVDLSSLQDGTGTDDQKVDSFALSGTTLGISLENDGVAPVTVDLSSLQDADWYENGGTPPNSINDNIYTQGNVAIGSTAASYRLDVSDSQATSYVMRINNTSTGTNADGLLIRLANSLNPGSNNYFVAFNSGVGTNRGSIRGNGAGGVNYATTSDRRLKTNIISIKKPFDIIDKIQPRLYEYKAHLGTKEYGFIAQELQLVYPQAVSGDPNDNVATNPMMVDYSRLTPILTAGIKELKTEVEALKEENQKLKQQLKKYEDLEARLRILENKKLK